MGCDPVSFPFAGGWDACPFVLGWDVVGRDGGEFAAGFGGVFDLFGDWGAVGNSFGPSAVGGGYVGVAGGGIPVSAEHLLVAVGVALVRVERSGDFVCGGDGVVGLDHGVGAGRGDELAADVRAGGADDGDFAFSDVHGSFAAGLVTGDLDGGEAGVVLRLAGSDVGGVVICVPGVGAFADDGAGSGGYEPGSVGDDRDHRAGFADRFDHFWIAGAASSKDLGAGDGVILTGYSISQSSIVSPGTLANSDVLCVTTTRS